MISGYIGRSMTEMEPTAKSGGAHIEPARALDPRYYTDADAFERDKQRILFRTWQYAGHVSQLDIPGDFFAFSI